jgi:hypothetical protein
VEQGKHFSEAKPHIFSGTIKDRTFSSFYLKPTLSLEGPLPLTSSFQAYHWHVDFPSSVGDKNRLSSLMDQSTGQGLESPAARNFHGEPGQGQAGGNRVTPAAGCAPSATGVAPSTRGTTREKPGSDQSRPE